MDTCDLAWTHEICVLRHHVDIVTKSLLHFCCLCYSSCYIVSVVIVLLLVRY